MEHELVQTLVRTFYAGFFVLGKAFLIRARECTLFVHDPTSEETTQHVSVENIGIGTNLVNRFYAGFFVLGKAFLIRARECTLFVHDRSE